MDQQYYTLSEAAKKLSISRMSLQRWMKRLDIQSRKNRFDGRERLIDQDDCQILYEALYGEPRPID